MFKFFVLSVLVLSHRYIIFTVFRLVNGFFGDIFMSVKKYFHKSIDFIYLLCYFIDVANNGVWLSLVERFVRDEEVACSNHVTPILELQMGFFFYGYLKKYLKNYKSFIKDVISITHSSIFSKLSSGSS